MIPVLHKKFIGGIEWKALSLQVYLNIWKVQFH